MASIDEWETLEILSDPAALAAIVEARADIQDGRVFTAEDILADLEARQSHTRGNGAHADSVHGYERPAGA
jgi:hypothetical protein